MNNKVYKKLMNIYEHSKLTKLYSDMRKRKGKLAMFKGDMNPDILFIGEAPDKEEDSWGIPFIGRSGQLIDKWIEYFKLDSFAFINAVPICPMDSLGKLRKPTKNELDYFRPKMYELIDLLNPRVIVLLGRSAEELVLGKTTLKVGNYTNFKGYKCIFVYHPAYYLRNGTDGINELKETFTSI